MGRTSDALFRLRGRRIDLTIGAGSITAIVTYRAIGATGKVIRATQNRPSWFLVKPAGRWLIAHEHTSAPIRFDDQKAMLKRE